MTGADIRYPLIAPAVSPATICRWKNKNMISGRIVMTSTSAKSRFHCELNWLMKLYSVSCAVTFCCAGQEVERARRSRCRCQPPETMITVIIAGRSNGRMIEKNTRNGDAPSMMAASSISLGMDADERAEDQDREGQVKATSTMIRPMSVLYRRSRCSRKIVGTTAGGMISPASIIELAIAATRPRRRCMT